MIYRVSQPPPFPPLPLHAPQCTVSKTYLHAVRSRTSARAAEELRRGGGGRAPAARFTVPCAPPGRRQGLRACARTRARDARGTPAGAGVCRRRCLRSHMRSRAAGRACAPSRYPSRYMLYVVAVRACSRARAGPAALFTVQYALQGHRQCAGGRWQRARRAWPAPAARTRAPLGCRRRCLLSGRPRCQAASSTAPLPNGRATRRCRTEGRIPGTGPAAARNRYAEIARARKR